MSTTTFAEIQDRILSKLGTSENADRALVKTYINDVGRDIWRSYPWWERKTYAWTSTVAPYTTGTVTTTKGAATVTGSGTVFPAASATRPYKFAAGYGEQWYEVSARGGDTSLTLDRNWAQTALSGSAYVLYDDRVVLASDVDVLLTKEVWIAGSAWPKMKRLSQQNDDILLWASGSGTPWWFTVTSDDASGYRRLRLGPYTPDDTYGVYYAYLKEYTKLASDSDIPELNENLIDVLYTGVLGRAYEEEPWRDTNLSERSYTMYRTRLAEEIKRARQEMPDDFRIKTFDDPGGDNFSINWILPST